MTIREFVITRAIIETENDCLIDASSELMTREEMEEWANSFINPQLDWGKYEIYKNKDFATDQELAAALKESNCFFGRTIVKAALKSQHRPGGEDFYINDDAEIHVKIPKRFVK